MLVGKSTATTPTDPGTTVPTDPGTVTPTDPGVTAPTDPGAAEPPVEMERPGWLDTGKEGEG